MTSEPNRFYQYWSIDPDIFTQADKDKGDYWPPGWDPKPGTIYPRVRCAYLFTFDTHATEYEDDHDQISDLLMQTETTLKKLALALLPTEAVENPQNFDFYEPEKVVRVRSGWTEREVADWCTKMQPRLEEQFEEFIGTFELNRTRLTSAWVKKQVVCDAAHIHKSAEKNQLGTMIVVSKQDTTIALAHYSWGPEIYYFDASQSTFKQQTKELMGRAPDLFSWLDSVGLDDEIFPEAAGKNGFGVAEISHESMVEFSWLKSHTGTPHEHK